MIKQILSSRYDRNSISSNLVNEWEDILSRTLNLPIVPDNKTSRTRYFYVKFPKLATFRQTGKPSFLFTMLPLGNPPGDNKKNIITCIIDFFLRNETKLKQFYKTYDRNPMVLISSKEAYDFLKSVGCPLNIRHWALSISDKYALSPATHFDKRYDVVLVGRQNPVMMQFLKEYEARHPEIYYAYRKPVGNKWMYCTNRNERIGEVMDRDGYMKLISQAKVGLYATPGMDGTREGTNGFSQVTPRFLEYLVSGCHVIARYTPNADTDYYELEKFSPCIDMYEDFEKAMDYALEQNVDMEMYSEYLKKHYTSVRAEQLKKIMEAL